MRQEKWIRFRLLIVSAFIFPYICWTDEENKSEIDVILPRCDKFHEMDESYFDRLEFIERHLRDSIQRIHDFDRLSVMRTNRYKGKLSAGGQNQPVMGT